MKIALNQDIRINNILLRIDIANRSDRNDRRDKFRNNKHISNYSQHPHNNNHHNHHNHHHYPNSHRGNSSAPNNTYVNSKANLPGHYHHKTNNNLSPSGSTVLSTTSAASAPASASATPPAPPTTNTSTAGASLADRVNSNNNGNNSNTNSGINQSQQRHHQRQQQLTATENAQILSEGHAIHLAVPNHPSSSLQFVPGDPYSLSNAQQNNNHANHTSGINKLSRPPSHMSQPMAFVDSYGMFYDASGMPLNMAPPFNPAVSMPSGPMPNHGEGQIEQATAMLPTPNVYYPYGPPPSAFGYPHPNAMLPHSVPQAVQQQHGPSNPSRYNPNQQAGADVNGANGAQQPQPQQPLYYMNYWNGQPFYYDQANTPGGPPSIYHPTIHPFFMSSAAFLPNAQTPQTFNTQQQQQLHQNSEVTPNHPLPRRQPSAPHQMPYGHGGELSSTIVKNTTAPSVDIPSATSYNIESSNTNNTN